MVVEPAFVDFFEGAFQRAIDATRIPDMDDASWDRKAAYLLRLATDRGTTLGVTTDNTQQPDNGGGIFE